MEIGGFRGIPYPSLFGCGVCGREEGGGCEHNKKKETTASCHYFSLVLPIVFWGWEGGLYGKCIEKNFLVGFCVGEGKNGREWK